MQTQYLLMHMRGKSSEPIALHPTPHDSPSSLWAYRFTLVILKRDRGSGVKHTHTHAQVYGVAIYPVNYRSTLNLR